MCLIIKDYASPQSSHTHTLSHTHTHTHTHTHIHTNALSYSEPSFHFRVFGVFSRKTMSNSVLGEIESGISIVVLNTSKSQVVDSQRGNHSR